MAGRDSEAGVAEGAGRGPAARLSLTERLGAAIVSPRRALASADGDPGRTSGDAALLMVLYFVAAHTEVLVSAVWLGIDGQVGAGLQALVGELTRTITAPLAFLFGGGVLVTLLAGRRRSIGADFDLAAVALVPLLAVHGAGWLFWRAVGAGGAGWLHDGVNLAGYAWAAGIVGLAVLTARSRSARKEEKPA